MKKILYIITQSAWGGAQRYVFDLATNLSKSQDYKIHIASGGNGPLLSRLEAQKLPTTKLTHLVRQINPYQDLMAYFEIKTLLNHIKPDIVHLNSSKAGFLGSLAAKAASIPKIIYTAHGFVFNEPSSSLKKWLYKKIELNSSKRIDKIICVSNYDRATGITAGIEPGKLITIYNGIDNSTMKFLSKNEAINSLLINQSTNKPVIGTIANFYPSKGLDVLIQAMTKVDANLIIIGNGALREELEKLVKKLNLENKIFMPGGAEIFVEAAPYLKAFDLFVLPSRKEGLPYTLLEAQAANLPIVAACVGGIPEIITDKTSGYLVAPDDPAALSAAINTALAHPLPSGLVPDCSLATMVSKINQVYAN